jgi:hypothetical protein
VGKPEGTKPLRRFRRSFEGNIKKIMGRNNYLLTFDTHIHCAENENIRDNTQAAGWSHKPTFFK